MYTNRFVLQEYPHIGLFYTVAIDESKPLDQQVEEKIPILETSCDITESSHTDSGGFISSKYSVYVPFDPTGNGIDIRAGHRFEASMYGVDVNGKVVGVFPSQLGGITVYIQDIDV